MSSRNSLLVVTPVIPRSLFSGEQLYTYNLYRALSKYLDITLVGNEDVGKSVLDLSWAKELVEVPRSKRAKQWSVASTDPSGIFQFYSPEIKSALQRLCVPNKIFNVIDCNSYLMYRAAKYYNKCLVRRGRSPVPAILVTHNLEAMARVGLAEQNQNFFVKKALQWDFAKIQWHENKALRSFDEVTAITPDDADYISNIIGRKVLPVVPGYDGVKCRNHQLTPETRRQVIVLGSFLWEAKRLNILKLVKAAAEKFTRANIKLKIVGVAPVSLMEAMKAYPFVEITGAVDSFEEHLLESRIAIIAEGVGGGFKLKSLDYIFHKIPMAILSGSISGVPVYPGKHFLGYETVGELVDGIVMEIDNVEKLNGMAEAAYVSCEDAFNWDDRASALNKLIERLIADKTGNYVESR